MHLDRLEVGEQHVAVLEGGLLLAEEKLRGAQPQRILGGVEDVAHDDVRKLVDEHRRHVDRCLEEVHVRALDRAGGQQPVAKAHQDSIVVSGVRIFYGVKVLLINFPSGVFHERGMQGELAFARLLHRMYLRAQVVRAQEIVGDPQPAGRVAF